MNRTECGACGGAELHHFLDLGKTPLANSFPETIDAEESYFGLGLCRCRNCGMVQNTEVIPDEWIYGGESYGFYSGGSPAQLAYHAAGADLLLRRYAPHGVMLAVCEVACNDGSLLQHFDAAGHTAWGVDPAAPAEVAIERGLDVLRQPFTAALGMQLRQERGAADLIIAYNSMAHVNDLGDVLTGMWAMMAPKSRAVIEVQYLPDLLVGNMYDQVYHEHRYFHSLTSFSHLAGLHNLRVIDAELIELQNGGIRITLAPTSNTTIRPTSRVQKILQSERWLTQDAAYDSMQGRVDRARDHLLAVLGDFDADGVVVAGYAASAKATTILNYCELGPAQIPFVVDATPQKWGKFVPGTRIPIERPYRLAEVGVALLLAPNYISSAVRNSWFTSGGKWIVPLPAPVVVG